MSDIIITNLSILRTQKPQSYVYSSDIGGIEGVYTNDAPVKYLISMIVNEGRQPSKIIAVTTEEADNAYVEFCKTIRSYGKAIATEIPVPTKIRSGDDNFAKTINSIISNISSGDKIWIDTTGGFRNSSYLLMAVVRILEYSGIKLEKAVYSNLDQLAIKDITSTYKMFDLINAANSFTSFGNSDELMQFFELSDSPEIKNVINAMNEFSDAVALCRTSDLDAILEKLNEGLVLLGKFTPTDENEILFKSVSGVIRDKFSIGDKEKIDYADVILWCVQNKMIQQAVTVYTEKIGEFLYNRCYTASAKEHERIMRNKKDYDNFYYSLFYEGFMTMETTFLGRIIQKSYNNNSLRETLLSAQNVGEITQKLHYINFNSEHKRDLKKLFRLRRAFYDDKAARLSYDLIEQNLLNHPEYIPFKDITAKTFEGFLNTMNNLRWLRKFYSDSVETMPYHNTRLNTIEQLERAYKEQTAYTMKIEVSHMQAIMRDYLYIKSWLRNAFNHASDNKAHTEEEIAYFNSYGYNTDVNPSLRSISEIIEKAVKRLKGEDVK